MKTISKHLSVALAAVLLSILVGIPMSAASTAAPPIQTGQVLAFRAAEPKPGIDLKAFEGFAADVYVPTWRKHAPGMKCFLIKGERGKEKTKYIDVWAFDSVHTRDFYFPNEGGGASETGKKILDKAPDLDYGKYFKTSEEQVDYTDYVVLGQGGSIEGSEVIALRPLKLKPGVDPDAFEKFAVEVFAPAMDRYAPGMRGFVLKGERGKNKGQYVHVWTFDSVETRNFYFPTEGGDPSTLGQEMLSHLSALEWDKYLKESEDDIYTDWVVLE